MTKNMTKKCCEKCWGEEQIGDEFGVDNFEVCRDENCRCHIESLSISSTFSLAKEYADKIIGKYLKDVYNQ